MTSPTTSDIVERLRARADDKFIRDAPLMREAADEIERLRERHDHDLSDAEDLLLEIANSMEKDFIDPVAHVDWILQAAKKYLIERAKRVR